MWSVKVTTFPGKNIARLLQASKKQVASWLD
jgi:hypothetical protein